MPYDAFLFSFEPFYYLSDGIFCLGFGGSLIITESPPVFSDASGYGTTCFLLPVRIATEVS